MTDMETTAFERRMYYNSQEEWGMTATQGCVGKKQGQ